MGFASKVLPIQRKIVIHVCEWKQVELFFRALIILSKPVHIGLKFSGTLKLILLNFKGYFYVFDKFYKCRLKACNSAPKLKII